MSIKVEQRLGRNVKTSTIYTKEELDLIFGGNIAEAGEAVGRQSELDEKITAVEIEVKNLFAQQIEVSGDIFSSNYSSGVSGWKIFGATGNAEFNDVVARGEFIGTINATEFVIDSGKLLSPVSFQFRNEGDTAFRDVQMAGLTATTGVFTDFVQINRTGQEQIRLKGGSGDPFISFWNGDVERLGFIQYNSTVSEMRISSEEGGIEFSTGTGGSEVSRVSIGAVNGDVDIMTGDLYARKNIFVEGGLFAREFIVDVTRNQSSVRMSPTAGGKIAQIISSTVGSEQVKFEDEDGNEFTPFNDNDLVQIQVATGASSGTIVKSIKRRVSADGQPGNQVNFTTVGVTTGTDVGVIEIGDDVTHAGNSADATRDHYIDFITAGVTIPYIGVMDEVTDFGSGFESVRFGGVNSFDASITGDAGIMGATQADGAVFWITEDEAKIADFTFVSQDLYSTSGNSHVTMSTRSSTSSSALAVDTIRTFGFSSFRENADVATDDSFKLARMGRISAKDTTNDFSGSLWGFQLGVGASTMYKDVFRVDGSGAFLYDLTVGGQLSIGSGGSITGTNWTISETTWSHPTLGAIVFSREELATFAQNDTASSLTDEEWNTYVERLQTGTSSRKDTKIRTVFRKRNSLDTLLVSMYTRAVVISPTGTTSTHKRNVFVKVTDQETSATNEVSEQISGSSSVAQTLQLDLSSLTDGNSILLEIGTDINVDITATDLAEAASTEAWIREDVTAQTVTD